jgi:hypothetical protein
MAAEGNPKIGTDEVSEGWMNLRGVLSCKGSSRRKLSCTPRILEEYIVVEG